jgi:hypothetical protein
MTITPAATLPPNGEALRKERFAPAEESSMKDVFAIYESRDGKERSRWVRVGVAFDNKDGSLNLLIDAVPLSGRLQVRPRAADSGTRTATPPSALPGEEAGTGSVPR